MKLLKGGALLFAALALQDHWPSMGVLAGWTAAVVYLFGVCGLRESGQQEPKT